MYYNGSTRPTSGLPFQQFAGALRLETIAIRNKKLLGAPGIATRSVRTYY